MKRYLELDALRTIAILLMVVYHAVYDLWAFHGFPIDPFSDFWKTFVVITASLFLLLVGASFVIAWERQKTPLTKALERAGVVLLAALLVTIATYLFDPRTFVRFGILHMIGASLLLLPFFQRFRQWNIPLGLLLLFFDLPPPAHTSIDYYPMLPWFGVVLIGSGIGHVVYVRPKRTPHATPRLLTILTSPGRHSLLIYLLHQPLLLLALRLGLGPVS